MNLVLTVFALAARAIQLGLEYNENLRFIKKSHNLIQEVNVKPRKAGIEVTAQGIHPIRSITKDGLVNLFELYELTPEEVAGLYGHLLTHDSGVSYKHKGFTNKVTPTVLNALFLSNFDFLKGCESLVVTKRDYLDDREESVFNTFQVLNIRIKCVVPESLAYVTFLVYESKITAKRVVTINMRGAKTVLSLYEVEIESAEESKDTKIGIKAVKTAVLEGLSDNHIQKVIKDHVKEKIQATMTEKYPISFLPGTLKDNMYCDLDTICKGVVGKLKAGILAHRIDWVDLLRIEGHNTVSEAVEIDLRDIWVKIEELISSKSAELKAQYDSFVEGVDDKETVILTEFGVDRFYKLLPVEQSLGISNSESGISKGAFYLTYPLFTAIDDRITSAHTKKKFSSDDADDVERIRSEVRYYQRLEKILKEIGGREIKEILNLCSDAVVTRLQSLLDKAEWTYENAKTFVGDYAEYTKRNLRLKDDAKFRDQYIQNMETLLEKTKGLESDTDLWKYIKDEYLDIHKWFGENKTNLSTIASVFKEKYHQLEDSISFSKNKLLQQKTQAAIKLAEEKKKAEENVSAEKKDAGDSENPPEKEPASEGDAQHDHIDGNDLFRNEKKKSIRDEL